MTAVSSPVKTDSFNRGSAMEVHFLSIAEVANLIAERQLSPVELTQMLLDRVEALDRQISSFITVTADVAMAQARQAETEIVAGQYRGPLHGIPLAFKDVYNTAGVLTSAHSKLCLENVPNTNATAVAKLLDCGAVLLGKLATHEFSHGGPSFDLPWPPARNPWNPAHFTGGSSSGSAAAVASGFVFSALGTDAGGSIREPASLCGVVGLKPTFGLVSRSGTIPNVFSFDHCGPITRTVEDCAIVLEAIAGYDPQDPASICRPTQRYRVALNPDIRGLRIGVLRHFWEEDVDLGDDISNAMDTAIQSLSRLGARIEVARMRPLQEYWDVRGIIAETEPFAIHQRDLIERLDDFGIVILGRILPSCLFLAVDYVQAQRVRRKMIGEMSPLYEKYDVLITAGAGPAPRFDAQRKLSFFDRWALPNVFSPFNITGGPALAMCNGFSSTGLPLGMQIAGRPLDEQTVLNVALAYEQETGWRERRPILSPEAALVPIEPPSMAPDLTSLAKPTRQLVEMLAHRAGLKLTDNLLALLCEAAPYAFAMSDRLNRSLDRFEEPADVFRLSNLD